MRKENLFEQEVKADLQDYENYSFRDKFVEEAKKTPATSKSCKKAWFFWGLASLVLVIVATSVLFFVPKEDNQVGYLDDNIGRNTVDIAKVNGYFSKHKFSESINWSVDEAFDNISNDVLFYELTYSNTETAQNLSLFVIVNPKYTYKNAESTLRHSLASNDLTWKYNVASDGEELVTFNIKGETTCENIKIYFKYTELSLSTESSINDLLKQVLVAA